MNILVARCFCNACGHKADLDPAVFRKAGKQSRLRCSHCKSYDTGLRQCWMAPHELLPTNVVALKGRKDHVEADSATQTPLK